MVSLSLEMSPVLRVSGMRPPSAAGAVARPASAPSAAAAESPLGTLSPDATISVVGSSRARSTAAARGAKLGAPAGAGDEPSEAGAALSRDSVSPEAPPSVLVRTLDLEPKRAFSDGVVAVELLSCEHSRARLGAQ